MGVAVCCPPANPTRAKANNDALRPVFITQSLSCGLVHPKASLLSCFKSHGKVDLAVANNASDSVAVLPGNGEGGFGPTAGRWVVGARPVGLAAGDFNADGKLDLAVGNESSYQVTLLTNTTP